ncbi:tryptophan synthase beta subunit-like PLP-dependent enzyme [Fusarium tricinctum]|uniref:Tryptophan synthase beta subunit-like PLP-dependent enzyme n=1 Tax=Fusarium tricinctum TaxID=61284 RepID=A0A8K0S5T4_9HYPO|nr:tryptophan synthase beta subunit-like PLP-dependent enzyme [Fusarium tricinctum]
MASLPAPFRDIPRAKLLFDRPLVIEPLSQLTATLCNGVHLWIQREDCSSGLAFGGNKVRKLEYILADALIRGADTVVTTGGIQSNHMSQTAAAAVRLGLEVALYPRSLAEAKDVDYNYAGNVQVQSIIGAERFAIDTSEESVINTLKKRGKNPYSIPTGASSHPLGGLGFARWAFELLEQELMLGMTFDIIVVAAGSGSTLGGMVAGFKLAQKVGRQTSVKRLIGFSIFNPSAKETAELVLGIAKATASKIGLSPDEITTDDFEIDSSYLGGGYGNLDNLTVEGIKELARLEGILTDPVYTGKAFTGMLHNARSGQYSGKNVLFCHTGGQAALSAYPQLR